MKPKKLVTQGGEMTKKELKRVALEMADTLVAANEICCFRPSDYEDLSRLKKKYLELRKKIQDIA